MKLSQIASRAQDLLNEHGDLDVGVMSDEGDMFGFDPEFVLDVIGLPDERHIDERTVAAIIPSNHSTFDAITEDDDEGAILRAAAPACDWCKGVGFHESKIGQKFQCDKCRGEGKVF